MVFSTHRKAIIAQAKVIATLVNKDYDIFVPIGDHLPFDLIAYKNNTCYRIQSKYAGSGFLNKTTFWYSKNTTNKKEYKESDFDYYGAYLPDKDIVVFPASKFAGCTISSETPNSPTPIYWYQDFIDFTQDADKRTYKYFGLTFEDINKSPMNIKGKPHPNSRKIVWPSKEELEKLIWEMPTTHVAKKFGVSDVAVGKWCNSYGIVKPPRGYWKKK